MIALHIALNGLRTTLRQREAIFWIFIGPLLMAGFFGIVFRPQPPAKIFVDVVNQDTTEAIAQTITGALQRDGVIVSRAANPTGRRLAVVVPAGAAGALAAGQRVEVALHAGTDETRQETDLRFKIYRALVASTLGAGGSTDGPLTIVKTDIADKPREITAGFQRSVPSYMVMFVFLNLLVSGVGIAEERRLGLLRRLGMAPISRRQIVLGKLLGRFAVGWIQMAWLLLAGRLLFGVRWAEHGWLFAGFLSLFALACASLGIFFGTLFKDPDKCRGIAVWTAILLAPLGGLWWPIEIVGPTLRRVAHLVPTGWAIEPINAMLAFGAGPREVLPFAAAFVLLFAVTFALAARRLEAL